MKTKKDVDALERLIVQLKGLHDEISQLAKKSPNDGLNTFKLKLVNKVIEAGNAILCGSYRPFADFDQFDSDSLPSNSDVTMIIAQYIQQAERYRSDNVCFSGYKWYYLLNGEESSIIAEQATRVGGEKK